MCQSRDHLTNVTQRRTGTSAHERLDAIKSAVGGVFKGKGGAPKTGVRDKGVQADVATATLQSRMLLPSLAVLACCLLLNQVGLFVPVVMVVRNCVMPKTPRLVRPKYPSCPATGEGSLAHEMTIVVSVKDACSQAPGFIRGLEVFAPPEVHLIYTFPNFESCAKIDLKEILARWHKVTLLPLPLRSSPMQGWVDAIPYIKTRYSMLLHNDGYALDSFFGCELLQSLKWHQQNADPAKGKYVLAAPMLYESKQDGSLAAHATQTNLRLVKDDSPQGMTVHHDHSLRRALNRGNDFKEGDQTEFVEDHGFLIETDKIATVIDPAASFTLEYLDMIMTIRANHWKALFVPSARLEFRITEFSWRDIPYFMYKRSEATAHGTRDYLKAKWQANFPNTGFWTYIKYTIVEQHVYGGKHIPLTSQTSSRNVLDTMAWKDQAALVFGFFQMAGYNRYDISKASAKANAKAKGGDGKVVDFLDVLQRLDKGWSPPAQVRGTRKLSRPPITKTRPASVDHLSEILPYGKDSRVEAEIEHEYLPFSMAKLTLNSCEQLTAEVEGVCGVVVEEPDGLCVCWINMPTFKSDSLFIRFLAKFAAMIKVPSRVTTFVEMALSGSRNGTTHVQPLRKLEGNAFSLATCDIGETNCNTTFSFQKGSRLKLFRGAPATVPDVAAALASL
jgi:hypothetical protein